MSTTITTRRLLLRPLARQDLGALVRGLNNFAVSQWTARIPFPYVMEDAEAFLQIASRDEPGTLRLSIMLDRELIGGIGYERAKDQVSAELGYWLAERHWRQGFGREAARAVTAHAFATTDHERLVASYRHGNEASRRILEGLGFRKTGDAMNYSLAVGSEAPVARMELSRADWEEAKGRRP